MRLDACLVPDVDLPGIDRITCKLQLDTQRRHLPTVFVTALSASEVNLPLALFATL